MSNKLYVGNIPFEASRWDVKELMAQFGEIEHLYYALDNFNGRPRGFAFVTYVSEEDAATATEKLNGAEFGDRNLRVNPAVERDEREAWASGEGAPPHQENDSAPSGVARPVPGGFKPSGVNFRGRDDSRSSTGGGYRGRDDSRSSTGGYRGRDDGRSDTSGGYRGRDDSRRDSFEANTNDERSNSPLRPVRDDNSPSRFQPQPPLDTTRSVGGDAPRKPFRRPRRTYDGPSTFSVSPDDE